MRALAIVIMVAVLVGVITLYRTHALRDAETQERLDHARAVEVAIKDGQRAFREVPVRPLATLHSVDDVESHLRSLAPAPVAAHAKDQQILLREAAELVYHRFLQPTPQAYRAWREAKGYRLRDTAAMRREMVHRDYEHFLEKPSPGDDHLIDVFDALWTATLAARSGSSLPVALADDAAGVAVAFGSFDRTGTTPPPQLASSLPSSAWHGKHQVALGRDWWLDPHGGFQAYRREHDTIPIATIGVILEMKKGDRYPISFTYYKDGAGAWWLWRINAHNVPGDRLVQLEF